LSEAGAVPPTLAELLPIAVEAVDRAARAVRERSAGHVTMKGDRDPATDVDYAVERDVRDFLAAHAPGIGFLGEEGGRAGQDGDHVWALDPVDGTVNYVHGVPLCGVSLGLTVRGEPALGVIDLPFLGLRYSAVAGGGAYRGDERIRASTVTRLPDAVVALGDYAVGDGARERNADRLRITGRVAERAQRVRMFGSAAVDLAWVAEGRIGAGVMLANKPWDVTAGVLLCREAGALVTDRHGRPHDARAESTVAAAPGISAELVDLLSP
jgi:myo-inositol-1(or 4)-monophosphatase